MGDACATICHAIERAKLLPRLSHKPADSQGGTCRRAHRVARKAARSFPNDHEANALAGSLIMTASCAAAKPAIRRSIQGKKSARALRVTVGQRGMVDIAKLPPHGRLQLWPQGRHIRVIKTCRDHVSTGSNPRDRTDIHGVIPVSSSYSPPAVPSNPVLTIRLCPRKLPGNPKNRPNRTE